MQNIIFNNTPQISNNSNPNPCFTFPTNSLQLSRFRATARRRRENTNNKQIHYQHFFSFTPATHSGSFSNASIVREKRQYKNHIIKRHSLMNHSLSLIFIFLKSIRQPSSPVSTCSTLGSIYISPYIPGFIPTTYHLVYLIPLIKFCSAFENENNNNNSFPLTLQILLLRFLQILLLQQSVLVHQIVIYNRKLFDLMVTLSISSAISPEYRH